MYALPTHDTLFSRDLLGSILDHQALQCLMSTVASIPTYLLLTQDMDWLAKTVIRRCTFKPLALDRDQVTMAVQDKPGLPATTPGLVWFQVPYTGTRGLWHLCPPVVLEFPLRGVVGFSRAGADQLSVPIGWDRTRPAEECEYALNHILDRIEAVLDAQAAQLADYHEWLAAEAPVLIQERYNDLADRTVLAKALCVPLEELDEVVPQIKGRVHVDDSPMFASVLHKIRAAGATFEEAPEHYAAFQEEGMRQHLRSHLSIDFPGRVTAETFRGRGKTDILIEDEHSREAIVTECKLWYGSGSIPAAIRQLLGYMAQRDSNGVLVLFNQTVAAFSRLKEQVNTALLMEEHSLYSIGSDFDGEWRYAFRSADDDEKIVTIHVFAFNLYVPFEQRVKLLRAS